MLAILDKLSLMSLNLTSPHGTHKKIMFSEIKRLSPGRVACFHELESTKSAQCENLPSSLNAFYGFAQCCDAWGWGM